ncbi:hypothetical protein [Desulforamulus ruminis]|uniref:DUF4878 domain-containing protein n=1 Tax=Desulforamulus ruminis (strain ATCC 23193 / DSM 2154 / NCIMB 8452 / DL) TaxID=696281 RepID=F6DVB5_DESRL|nr:hypothetical protein [Desulforamulus ruminis]AEG60268.1 hypothetical protein Desru_2012 [Desulforamulus ruminis DSM 2154]
MKKLLAVLCLLGLLLLSSVPAFAGTDTGKDAEGILTNYLNAIVNQNVDEILTLVIDERYSSDGSQKEEYTHFLEEKKLIDYKIKKMSQESPTQINFETILTFDNGSIERVPIVLKNDKSWKVFINEKSLEKNYEVIQEGNQKIVTKPQEISPQATTLVSWSFTNRGGGAVFYSNNSFNISGSTATLASVTQTHDYVNLGWPVGITYAIVKKGILGDSMWGQRYLSGSISNPVSVNVSGSGSYTGAQVRFTTDIGNTSSMGYRGSGSLTQ